MWSTVEGVVRRNPQPPPLKRTAPNPGTPACYPGFFFSQYVLHNTNFAENRRALPLSFCSFSHGPLVQVWFWGEDLVFPATGDFGDHVPIPSEPANRGLLPTDQWVATQQACSEVDICTGNRLVSSTLPPLPGPPCWKGACCPMRPATPHRSGVGVDCLERAGLHALEAECRLDQSAEQDELWLINRARPCCTMAKSHRRRATSHRRSHRTGGHHIA